MFLLRPKLVKFHSRAHVFQYHFMLSTASVLLDAQVTPQTSKDTVSYVLALIKQPNWQQNNILKSIVSHMTPHVASQVIQLHCTNIHLVVRFFKWVCKQSTYCYDIDSRVLLLKLLVSFNLYGIAHKAIVVLINEFLTSKNDILKLMGAFDEIREFGFKLNYPCYSTLLVCLAKLDMGFVAYRVYKRMVDDCFVVAGIDYRTIINALCKDGLVEASEMFFCRVLKLGFDLDTHICTSLVLGYCRRRNILGAFKVFAIMSRDVRCGPNSVTFSTLIHGLCEVGRLEEAFVLKEEMSEMGCQPTTRTYTVLIKALCDIGSMDKALSLLEEMVSKRCKPNIYTYTVLIDGLCKNKKLEEANGIFRKMLNDGLFPGLVTYNALINGYCKEGEIVSAFELLSVMEKRNCKPNILTYNELMEGLCRVNKTYKAMSLLRQIIDDGLLPNGVTYNILINGFCKEGKLGMAFKIFYSINSFGLESDPYTFTEMIDGLCKKGRLELANGILCLMIKKGILLDEVIFTALIDGYCKIGKTGDALMLFEKMGVSTYLKSPHVLNSFLDALSNENELNVVYAMLGKFMKYGLAPSVVTYTILIDALSKAGKITHSLNMMEEMKQAGCPPNVYTYTVIINGLCQNGRVEEAESLLYIMSDMGVSPNCITYTILVKAHVTAGRLDRAFEIVSTMIENGCQPNRRTYSALLVGIVTSNMASAAGRDINHLEARSLASEENATESISNSVLRAMDVEHALKLRAMIENCGGSTSDLYNHLVVGLCNVGRIYEAELLTKDVVAFGVYPDKAICSMIEWYCQKGRYEECLDFMNLVLHNGFVPCFSSYCLVIQGLRNEGKIYQAPKLVSELLTYNGAGDKIGVLQFIDFLLNGNEHDKCLQLLEEIEIVHCRGRATL